MHRPDADHRTDTRPAHLAYGNRYDPHAAECSCGWRGRIQPDRSRAENDAENHAREEASAKYLREHLPGGATRDPRHRRFRGGH